VNSDSNIPSTQAPTAAAASTKKKIIIGLVYVVGLLVLAELFYRFFWVDPPMTEVVRGNHPIFHHVPKAFVHSDFGEYDFRGNKYSVDKPAGRLRIAFIGDSFTYGFTPHDQTIPYHLKQKLSIAYPGRDIEVLNFGFVSYSPIIESVVYRRLVAPLKPDLVIMLYDTFDPQDDVLYAKSATFDENGMPTAVAGEAFLQTGLRKSALVRFLQFAWEVVKNDWHYLPEEQRFESRLNYLADPTRYQGVLDFSFATIDRLAKTIEASGSRFVLFQYPPPHVLQDLSEFRQWLLGWGVGLDWKQPDKSPFTPLVLDFCKRNDLRCFDFGPGVRAMENSLKPKGSMLKIYNNKDGHFTGWANDKFADFILQSLVTSEIIPTPQQPETHEQAPAE
jgi:hypothetical protein